jgi:hypothetical protein
MVNFDQGVEDASRCLARIEVGVCATTPRMLLGYVALESFFKFSLKEGFCNIFAVVEPCEQSRTASRADPGNVAFAVGADLANVAQKGRRSIAINRVKACAGEQARFPYSLSKPSRVFFRSFR